METPTTGIEETRRPSRLKNALAALGIMTLGAAPNALADAPRAEPSTAEALSEDIAAQLRDCAAEATGAKRGYMAEQIAANDIPAREARTWLRAQARKQEFRAALGAAGREAFQKCTAANLQTQQDAADQRLAAARARGRELEEQIALLSLIHI